MAAITQSPGWSTAGKGPFVKGMFEVWMYLCIVVDFDILDDVAWLLETTVGVERVVLKFRHRRPTP